MPARPTRRHARYAVVLPGVVRRVAARQHVHPDTVDYRIRRIAALTGLNPADHGDRVKLTAALAAFDTRQRERNGHPW